MKQFSSFAGLAAELVGVQVAMHETLHSGLERVMTKIEKTAVAEIGHYQDAAGPFPAWPELADSTEEQKAQMGYPAGAPLLASGDMQASAQHEVEGLEGIMGFTDEKMVFHEFGTSRMPARPVVGPAAFRNKAAIQTIVGEAAVAGFVGADQIHHALGYDFETTD